MKKKKEPTVNKKTGLVRQEPIKRGYQPGATGQGNRPKGKC